jgi:hypothetical protein
MDMEREQRQLTPSEQLFQRLETPVNSIGQVSEMNNEAVKLFTEGHLNAEQLVKFSLGLAKEADSYSKKILKTDMKNNSMPENKQIAYSAMLTIAQENRKRAIDLTLAQQKPKPANGRGKSSA